MISAKLIGGLGNQMFQIATTYAVALDNNDDCGFEFYYKQKHPRSSGNSPSFYIDNVFSRLQELPELWIPEYVFDDPYWDRRISYHNNMLLTGYLCNPVYFNHRRDDIIDLFYHEVKGNFKNSVAIHVRRGNYFLNSNCLVLPISYYAKALKYLESKVQIDIIYVFTEDKIILTKDMLWCYSHFKDKRVVFVSGFDYNDLYMMSMCTHHIIANSSFSWWSSYICKNVDKIICSPKEWFLDKEYPKPFMCDNWVLIDN